MKKYFGINRNKLPQFQAIKLTTLKKKNRFKLTPKDQDITDTQQPQTQSLVTTTTQNSATLQSDTPKILQLYQQTKDHLKSVQNSRHHLITQCQLRITAFKETQVKQYDKNISNLSKKAISHLTLAQKSISQITKLKPSNKTQQKYYRNLQKSLSQQLRILAKQLRSQQKTHLDRLKIYQKSTINTAIQLTQTQKQKMKSDIDLNQQSSINILEEQSTQYAQINQLVKNINQLSFMYKEMNQLVFLQGSIIDRIDYNIDDALIHVQKGNEHLKSAQEHIRNSCAQKCMLTLLALIIILAIILGIKYSK